MDAAHRPDVICVPEARGMIRKVAAERIEILYDASVRAFPKDPELAKSYIRLLLEIGRHYKVRIPKETAARICKKCCVPLIEAVNTQTRVIAKEKRIIYRCNVCGNTNSLLFSGKAKENRISIEIDAPIKEVFRFTINPKNTSLWINGILKEEASTPKVRIGTEYRNLNKENRWTRYRVSNFKRDRLFELKQLDSDYHVRYTYEPLAQNRTRLVYFEWVDKGQIEHPFGLEVLQTLKRIIEKQ